MSMRTGLCAIIMLMAIASGPTAMAMQQGTQAESNRLQLAATADACRTGDFNQFLFLFAQSAVVRAQYLSPTIDVGPEGRSRRVTRAAYQARHRFPIQALDYSLYTAASADAWERSRGRTGQLEHIVSTINSAADNRRRVDWSRATFVDDGGEGPGRATSLVGQPGALLFVPTEGCWALAADYRPARAGSLSLADVQRQ
jgi:hypothetical protein